MSIPTNAIFKYNMNPETKTVNYKSYRLLSVYNQITPKLKKKIIKLWNENNILPVDEDPNQRVNQVVIAILDQNENVVGVSTVYIKYRPILKENAFMYRMFIQPQDRVSGMMIQVVKATYNVLNSMHIINKPKSLMVISENKKLMRPGIKRIFKKHNLILLGQDQRGCDIWRWPFTPSSL